MHAEESFECIYEQRLFLKNGSSGYYAVDESMHIIHTEVHFHTEIPFIAILRLMLFKITIAVSDLCSSWCFNHRCIHYCVFFERQTFLF